MGLTTFTHPDIPGALLVGVRAATPSLRGLGRKAAGSEREKLAGATGCAMLFFLDGIQLRDVYNSPLSTYVTPSELAGVEVYRLSMAELPAEFSGSDSRCGVVAIWTKRGNER